MSRKIWIPVVSGPLAPYASDYESWLASRSYSAHAAADRVYQFDQLSRWMERQRLTVGELSDEQGQQFAASRRSRGLVAWSSPRSVALPLEFLREQGVAPQPVTRCSSGPFGRLLDEYACYLLTERGLCDHTVYDCLVPAALLFLSEVGEGRIGKLSPGQISEFLSTQCRMRSDSSTRDLASALRSFLRYLHICGHIEMPLDWAVPSVAVRADQGLPRGLDLAEVGKLLASCDRRRLVGRRDYAMLGLLARLGLRAGEVAGITLDDLDWRAGMLNISGKGGREDCLPIPTDVGEAIVSYLRMRPECESRALFLRITAPRRGVDRCTVAWAVRTACDRAGLERVGPHQLRHSAASGMLRQGASLAQIGQVLRHQDVKTTAIYAKVDLVALRSLVRPWPIQVGAK